MENWDLEEIAIDQRGVKTQRTACANKNTEAQLIKCFVHLSQVDWIYGGNTIDKYNKNKFIIHLSRYFQQMWVSKK